MGFKDLPSHVLSIRKLRAHAKDAVRARLLFVDRAKALVEGLSVQLAGSDLGLTEGMVSASILSKKIQARGTGVPIAANRISPSEYKEPVEIMRR